MGNVLKSIILEFKDSSKNSDKEYRIVLEKMNSGIVVKAAYGRRGGKLNRLVKYNGTSVNRASDLYNSLIMEKQAKGYKIIMQDGESQVLDDYLNIQKNMENIYEKMIIPNCIKEMMN